MRLRGMPFLRGMRDSWGSLSDDGRVQVDTARTTGGGGQWPHSLSPRAYVLSTEYAEYNNFRHVFKHYHFYHFYAFTAFERLSAVARRRALPTAVVG